MSITDGKVVFFHYTLTVDGEVIDSSRGQEPMPYLHGSGNIVPGLEKEMTGKSEGDSFEVSVTPEEGYGMASGELIPQPRSVFPADMSIEVGMVFGAETQDGQHVRLTVMKVDADQVYVTPDHPLAGKTLNFAIEVVTIRDASAEEMAHGHVHGPGGHQH